MCEATGGLNESLKPRSRSGSRSRSGGGGGGDGDMGQAAAPRSQPCHATQLLSQPQNERGRGVEEKKKKASVA